MHTRFAKLPWKFALGSLVTLCLSTYLVVVAAPPSDKATGESAKTSTTTQKSSKGKKMSEEPKYNKLTPEERWVLLNKGTEQAFMGKYTDHFVEGVYICKRCNAPLYESKDKFHSGCGWPAFDDEIKDSVKHEVDADGYRIEIMCNNCGGHLGHVFNGEMMTRKNTRHCVNSISIKFIAKGKEMPEVIGKEQAEENDKLEKAKSDKESESKDAKSDTLDSKSEPSSKSK